MTISTRSRAFLSRAGLVLIAAGALAFSAACNEVSPSDGDQQQEQQEDNGGDGDDDGGDDD